MSKLKSIEAYNAYGILRTDLLNQLLTKRQISYGAQCALKSYKLLVWSKELLQFKLSELEGGRIRRFNKDFIVVWDWTSNRGHFLREPLNSQWFISFREPQPEYSIPGIAYIWEKF